MQQTASVRTTCRAVSARCCRRKPMTDDDATRPDRTLPPAPGDDSLWVALRRLTAARIGLQRTGASLSTGPLLDFQLAHARARDAVHEPLDEARLIADLTGLGCPVLAIASAAESRQSYLMRPDRSEEHTSELQSRSDLVCRLLLEKKKKHISVIERSQAHKIEDKQ